MQRLQHQMTLIEAHAEGEIGRIVTQGVPQLGGASMAETLAWLNGEGEALRHFLIREPRGFAQMSTNLLLPPKTPGTDAGMIVLQPDKAHAMSGSNAICMATVLLETGRVQMQYPETALVLDTAAGPVAVQAECEDGKCSRVNLRMPFSFADKLDVELEVAGLGMVRLDIAFGGVFYALVEAAPLGLAIEPGAAAALVRHGSAIHHAVETQLEIRHPAEPALDGLAYVMFTSRDAAGPIRGATVMAPGRLDRSPCGTGNAARLAVMVARGEAMAGDSFDARSVIDSRFTVGVLEETEQHGRRGIIPTVSGRGWIYGQHVIGIDPQDPFRAGYTVADCWGGVADAG